MSQAETKTDAKAEVKKEPKKNGIIAKIKSVKHLDIIIAAVVVIIMLIIYFSTFLSSPDTKGDNKTDTPTTNSDYCAQTVLQLETKLSQVSGVGNVSVLVNWEYSEELVPAYSTNSSGSTTVVTTGGQIYILKTIYPTPKGVIIICDGASNITIKMNLISAVSSYFGIPENTITVLARSNNQN